MAQPGDSKHSRDKAINVFICTDLERNNIGTNGNIFFYFVFSLLYFLAIKEVELFIKKPNLINIVKKLWDKLSEKVVDAVVTSSKDYNDDNRHDKYDSAAKDGFLVTLDEVGGLADTH